MYTTEELTLSGSRARRALIASLSVLGAGLVLMVIGLIVRSKLLSTLGLTVPAMAAYFFYDMYYLPRHKYHRFVQDVMTGRSHACVGRVVAIEDAARMSEEDVAVRGLLVRVEGEPADSLFYWDDARDLPALAPQTPCEITAFGRYITQIRPAR